MDVFWQRCVSRKQYLFKKRTADTCQKEFYRIEMSVEMSVEIDFYRPFHRPFHSNSQIGVLWMPLACLHNYQSKQVAHVWIDIIMSYLFVYYFLKYLILLTIYRLSVDRYRIF